MKKAWQDTLLEILLTDTNSLLRLAQIAGGDPKTFYKSADFSGLDLKKIDTKGVSLPDELSVKRDEENATTTRLLIKIAPGIHELVKSGNPSGLSAHISVILRVFLDEHLDAWAKTRINSQRLEIELIRELSQGFKIVPVGISTFKRNHDFIHQPKRRVSYHIDENLKSRLMNSANRYNRSLTEFGRIAIYYVLLYDRIRSLHIYPTEVKEYALSEQLSSLIGTEPFHYSFDSMTRKQKSVLIRRPFAGTKFLIVTDPTQDE
jgi:hypothetical protein